MLRNCAMYKHKCLANINKLYTPPGKYNYQLQFKTITEASMVLTPEIFTYNSPMSPGPPMIVKKCIERKSLRLFTEVFDVKKTAVRRARLYFPEELRSDPVYSGTFLSCPVELRFPMPPETEKK